MKRRRDKMPAKSFSTERVHERQSKPKRPYVDPEHGKRSESFIEAQCRVVFAEANTNADALAFEQNLVNVEIYDAVNFRDPDVMLVVDALCERDIETVGQLINGKYRRVFHDLIHENNGISKKQIDVFVASMQSQGVRFH